MYHCLHRTLHSIPVSLPYFLQCTTAPIVLYIVLVSYFLQCTTTPILLYIVLVSYFLQCTTAPIVLYIVSVSYFLQCTTAPILLYIVSVSYFLQCTTAPILLYTVYHCRHCVLFHSNVTSCHDAIEWFVAEAARVLHAATNHSHVTYCYHPLIASLASWFSTLSTHQVTNFFQNYIIIYTDQKKNAIYLLNLIHLSFLTPVAPRARSKYAKCSIISL